MLVFHRFPRLLSLILLALLIFIIMKEQEQGEVQIDGYLLTHDFDDKTNYQGDEDYEDDPYGQFGKQD